MVKQRTPNPKFWVRILVLLLEVRKDWLSGCGSVWLERMIWDHEVASSNLVTPISIKTDA